MAVPKYKPSKSRTRRRRAQNMKLMLPTLVECPNCGNRIKLHHVCLKCGYYRGKQILKPEELA